MLWNGPNPLDASCTPTPVMTIKSVSRHYQHPCNQGMGMGRESDVVYNHCSRIFCFFANHTFNTMSYPQKYRFLSPWTFSHSSQMKDFYNLIHISHHIISPHLTQCLEHSIECHWTVHSSTLYYQEARAQTPSMAVNIAWIYPPNLPVGSHFLLFPPVHL